MEINQHDKVAWLIGAHERVGRKCLVQLLHHQAYRKVVVLMEEPLDFEHSQLEVHPFSLEKIPAGLPQGDVHDVFYCWDQTNRPIHKEGPNFDPADTYAGIIAQHAHQKGAVQFLFLSSVAADTASTLYYRQENRMVEAFLERIGFWGTHVFRPALVTEESPSGAGANALKWLGKSFGRWTQGAFDKYKPVAAPTVAQAMVQAAQGIEEGVFIYSSEYLQDFAKTNQKGIIRSNG